MYYTLIEIEYVYSEQKYKPENTNSPLHAAFDILRAFTTCDVYTL